MKLHGCRWDKLLGSPPLPSSSGLGFTWRLQEEILAVARSMGCTLSLGKMTEVAAA